MILHIRSFVETDLPQMVKLWNAVVEEGAAFPQETVLTEEEAGSFFEAQSFTAIAEWDGKVVGLYILHPNNVGRCGHLANASFAVAEEVRGQRIGEQLVQHCLQQARTMGFRVMQFNAVVQNNAAAVSLYQKLDFVCLGKVPGGFRDKYGVYQDILLFYKTL